MTPVIFDMDGTLLDSEAIYLEGFITAGLQQEVADKAHLNRVFTRLIGLANDLCQPVLATELPNADIPALNAAWQTAVKPLLAKGIPLKPGAVDLLAHLTKQGHPMAIATSTNTDHAHDNLRGAGLLSHFAHVIGGDMVTRRKPDPEIYHKAANALGIDIKTAVIFEDSNPGTIAAVASGARVVQVPDMLPPTEEVAALGHHIAPDLIAGARHMGLI